MVHVDNTLPTHEHSDAELALVSDEIIQACIEDGKDPKRALVIPKRAYSFLPRKHVASPTHNRIYVAVFCVLVHLCVGSVYAWSTYNKPILAIHPDWYDPAFTFSIAIALLGLSASFAGSWMEIVGPNVTAVLSSFFFGGGLCLTALAVKLDWSWLMFLGYGFISGIGLGLAYISPVSTLIKWFPDRTGLATGLAVMGFGGGASIASLTQTWIIDGSGVATAMLVHGIVYFCILFTASFFICVPPWVGWGPAGWSPPEPKNEDEEVDEDEDVKTPCCTNYDFTCMKPKDAKFHGDRIHVTLKQAVSSRQFYFLWFALFLNITAGIGVLSQLSPMTQAMFDKSEDDAALVVSFASVFNMLGRFFWAFMSDYIGRRTVFAIFGGLGCLIFATIPLAQSLGWYGLFAIQVALAYSMYGGGFACIPAVLADFYGSKYVGAIHGVILTAWSTAGLFGPIGLTAYSDYAVDSLGIAEKDKYNNVLFVMAGALFVEFILAAIVYPMTDKQFSGDEIMGSQLATKKEKVIAGDLEVHVLDSDGEKTGDDVSLDEEHHEATEDSSEGVVEQGSDEMVEEPLAEEPAEEPAGETTEEIADQDVEDPAETPTVASDL